MYLFTRVSQLSDQLFRVISIKRLLRLSLLWHFVGIYVLCDETTKNCDVTNTAERYHTPRVPRVLCAVLNAADVIINLKKTT